MDTIIECWAIDGKTSKMFTKGKKYKRNPEGYVIDDLGYKRFISSSMKFIIENTCNIWSKISGHIYYAYFR